MTTPLCPRGDNLTKVGSFIPILLGILIPILTEWPVRRSWRDRPAFSAGTDQERGLLLQQAAWQMMGRPARSIRGFI